mgnify:CR=1 FL=1
MKKTNVENKILVMLAFFSISVGLWGNFRQLWLKDNNFAITQISNILSIGTFISILGIMLIGKHISLNKLKTCITYIIIIKFINLLVLYFVNGTNLKSLIIALILIDIVMEYIIITSIYPLITNIVKNDKIYSKRKLTEYLFRDIGILIGGLFIGKNILGTYVNYNICLIISNVFLLIAVFVMLRIDTTETTKKEQNKVNIVKYIVKNKILVIYMIYVVLAHSAMSTALGLKILTLTNYFNFSDSYATNYLLLVGLAADVIGILALKFLTPKNDYVTITIKFGVRFIWYIIAFLSNNIIIMLIAITWSILISTSYENVCDAPYINCVENEYQLSFTNIRYIAKLFGEAIGVFLCGVMYELGLRYMLGLSAFIMIFQIALAYRLIYMKHNKTMSDITKNY